MTRFANLGGANLGGANLRGANLGGAYLGCAKANDDTTFPVGFDRKRLEPA